MMRLKLSWPGQYVTVTGQSFKDLTLELEKDGKVLESVPAISGAPGRQNEPFLSPAKDWSGSNHPIPEGVYEIGAVAKGKFQHALHCPDHAIELSSALGLNKLAEGEIGRCLVA